MLLPRPFKGIDCLWGINIMFVSIKDIWIIEEEYLRDIWDSTSGSKTGWYEEKKNVIIK